MEAFSALLALCAGNSLVTGEFPTQRPVTRSFDVSLIYASINGWVNNREAGDLRRHRAQYDVIVMNFTNIIMWLLGTLLSRQTHWRRFAFHQNLLPTLQRNYRYLLYSKNCWNRVVGFWKKCRMKFEIPVWPVVIVQLWPLLLTWFNINPSMDK